MKKHSLIENLIRKLKDGFITIEFVVIGALILIGGVGIAIEVRHGNKETADTAVERINADNPADEDNIGSTADRSDADFTPDDTVPVVDTTPPVINGVHDIVTDLDVKPDYVTGITAVDDVDGMVQVIIDDSNLNYHSLGDYTITYSASDRAGNTATAHANIKVKDSDFPVIVGVKPIIAEVGSVIDYLDGVSVKDKGGEKIYPTYDSSKVMESVPGKYPLIYYAVDSAGNKSSESTYVIIQDNTGPVFSGLHTINAKKGVTPEYLEGVKAWDNVDGDVTSRITYDAKEVNINKPGTYNVKYCVSDTSTFNNNKPEGPNTTCATSKVVVKDGVKPVLHNVREQTVEYKKTLQSTLADTLAKTVYATDDSDLTENLPIKVDVTKVNFKLLGTYPVTYSVTDSSGNTASQSSNVKIVDTTGPEITGNQDLTINLGMKPTYGLNVKAIDEYEGNATLHWDVTNVDEKKAGKYLFTYWAEDSLGNRNEVKNYINIIDNEGPVFQGIPDMIYHQYGDTPNVLAGIKAVDNNDGEVPITVDSSEVDWTDLNGIYNIYLTAKDTHNNISKATVKVKIIDTKAPIISGTHDFEIMKDEIIGNYLDGVSAEDNYDGVVDVFVDSSKVIISAIGKYPVTYTAMDSNGNTARETVTVTVKDLIPPTLSGIRDIHHEYGDTVPTMEELKSGVVAWDDTDGELSERIVLTGYETIKFDVLGSYPITFSVTDYSGNTASETVNVIVEDTTPPYFSGIVDLSYFPGETIDYLHDITATDNYDRDVTSRIKYSVEGDVTKPGIYVITYTVDDTHGNVNTAEANLTIKDKNLPVFEGIKNPITIEGGDTEYDYYAGVTATDPEDGPVTDTIQVDDSKVDYFTVGSYTVTYTATDKFDNVTTVNVTVKIVDTTPPTMIYGNGSEGFPDVTANIGDKNWIEDYISEISVEDIITENITPTIDVSKVDFQNPGSYPATIVAQDEAGNKATEEITVNIADIQAPVFDVYKDKIKLPYSQKPANIRDFYMGYIYSVEDDRDGTLLSSVVIDDSQVDYDHVGPYTVNLSVKDSSNNTATAQLYVEVVDEKKPVITGVTNISMTLSDYTKGRVDLKEGIKAWDEYLSTDLTDSVSYVVNNGEAIYMAGNYPIIYSVTDMNGNTATANATLTITSETDGPVIVLKSQSLKLRYGNKPANVEKYFRDNILAASDKVDGSDIKAKVVIDYSKTIDFNKVGSYTITYSYKSSNGARTEVKCDFAVIDDVPPVISGTKNITMSLEEYTKNQYNYLSGVTAYDDYDKKDLSSKVKYTVNDGQIVLAQGTYPLTYSVSDEAGNIGTSIVSLTITDNAQKPMILLTTYSLQFQYGETPTSDDNYQNYFMDYVYSATDPVEGDISDTLTVTHDVNFNQVGLYSVNYSAKNSKGATATAKMLVNVEDYIAPTITANTKTITADTFLKYVDLGTSTIKKTEFETYLKTLVTIKDNYDNTIPSSKATVTFDNIIANGVTGVNAYYKVKDSIGNEANTAIHFDITGNVTITPRETAPITIGMTKIRDTMNGKTGMTMHQLFTSYVTAKYGTTNLPSTFIAYSMDWKETDLIIKEGIVNVTYQVFSTKKTVQFKTVNDFVDDVVLTVDNPIADDGNSINANWATSRAMNIHSAPASVKITKYQLYVSDTRITDLDSLNSSTAWKDYQNNTPITTTGRYVYFRACQTKTNGETLCGKAFRFVLAVDTTAPVDSKVNALRKNSAGQIQTSASGLSALGINSVNGEYQTQKWADHILFDVLTQSDAHSGFAKMEYQIGENPSNNSSGGTTAVTDSNAVWGVYSGSTWQANQWAPYTNRVELKSSGWRIRFRLCDKLGNCRILSSRPYLIDNVAPSAFTVSGVGTDANIGWASSRNITLSGSKDKHSGVLQYEYCLKKATTDACTWTKFTNGVFNKTGVYIQFRVKDRRGLIYTNPTNYVLKVDSQTPVINSVTGGSTTWAKSKSFTITNNIPTSSSLTYYYATSDNATSGYGSWVSAGTGTTSSKTFNVTTTGKYVKFKVCLTNVLSVCSAEKSGYNAYVDATKPVIASITGTSTTPAKTRTLTLGIREAHSGTNRIEYATTTAFTDATNCTDSTKTKCVISNKSVKQAYLRVIDNAGNVSATSALQNIYVDVTPPPAVTINGQSTAWAKSRNLTLTAVSDNMSAVTYQYCASSVESECATYNASRYKNNGTSTAISYTIGTAKFIYATACDAVGNCATPTKGNLYVDNTVPRILSATGGGTSWSTSKQFTVSIDDLGSYTSSTPNPVAHTSGQSQVAKYQYYVTYENGTNSGWKEVATTVQDKVTVTPVIKEQLGKTIKFRAVDKAGNISAESSVLNLYTQTSFTITATGSTSWSSAASRSVALASTCKGTTTYSWTDSGGGHASATSQFNFTVASGSTVQTAKIKANCLGMSASATANIYLDRQAPTATAITGGSTTWAKSRNIGFKAATDAVSAVTYKYCASSNAAECSTYNSSRYASNGSSTAVAITSGTAKYIYAVTCDALGNCSTPVSGNLYVDNRVPNVSITNNNTGWATSHSVTINYNDVGSYTSSTPNPVAHTTGQSQMASYQYRLLNQSGADMTGWQTVTVTTADSGSHARTVNTNGAYYIEARSIDKAGNYSGVVRSQVPTQTSFSISGSGSWSWSNASGRTITLSSTCKGTTTYSFTDGAGWDSSTATTRWWDVASNTSVWSGTVSASCLGMSASTSVPIYIDRQPPAISSSGRYSGAILGNWRTTANISFSCSDGQSGVSSCPGAQSWTPARPTSTSTITNSKTLSGCVYDKAGNSACTSRTFTNLTNSYKAGTPTASRTNGNQYYNVYRDAYVIQVVNSVQVSVNSNHSNAATMNFTSSEKGTLLSNGTIANKATTSGLHYFPNGTVAWKNSSGYPKGATMKRTTRVYVRGNTASIAGDVTVWSGWSK